MAAYKVTTRTGRIYGVVETDGEVQIKDLTSGTTYTGSWLLLEKGKPMLLKEGGRNILSTSVVIGIEKLKSP